METISIIGSWLDLRYRVLFETGVSSAGSIKAIRPSDRSARDYEIPLVVEASIRGARNQGRTLASSLIAAKSHGPRCQIIL